MNVKTAATFLILSMLVVSVLGYLPMLSNADMQTTGTWVLLRGAVDTWGASQVFGRMVARAGMVDVNGTSREWARVHAVWSYEPRRFNCTEPPAPENFTLSYYTARLINTTDVSLDDPEYNLYVLGQWDVNRVSIDVIVDENGALISFTKTCIPLINNATGDLRVFSNWMRFEIDINGIDVLSGFSVGPIIIRHVAIRIFDVTGPDGDPEGKVDIFDLVRIAHRYRTVPGMWYDLEFDFNLDGIIDIGDLTAVAANIEG